MGTSSFAYLNEFTANSSAVNTLQDAFDPLSVRTLARGTYLFLPDDRADMVYYIQEGQIKLGTYGAGGKEITKAIYRTGEIVGAMALLGEQKHHNFACTLERVKVRVMKVSELQKKIRQHHSLHLELMRLVGQRLLATEHRLESMVFKNSRSRIIEYLHQLGQKQGQRVGYEVLVRKFFTHQEIANLTATSRQTVTTILNELRNDNIITFNRKRLLIRDMELLAKKVG
ncbi:Crp/Fnr family transcriptional regulator [Lewinella cohaerens]|uniref:Crp/Fnr family transcriptional regulator n=1 Tax=Lewinella cohaerens TaxID=70995 RepID=UPI0003730D9D|nr:Crp/Fnr family transcriptional regulator [Lewinella cohaerens]